MAKKLYLVILIIFITWACWAFARIQEAALWPHVKGAVISSTLSLKHYPNPVNLKEKHRWYGADVRYEYTVGDKRYSSSRVSFGDKFSKRSKDALDVMNRYRKYREPNVFYDPKNPRNAVLERWGLVDQYLFVIGVSLLIGFGMMLFWRNPSDPYSKSAAHIHQGYVYQNQGRLNEALAEYNQAIALSPSLSTGYAYRGIIYLKKGDWDNATANFDQALALDKNDAMAKLGKKSVEEEKAQRNDPG